VARRSWSSATTSRCAGTSVPLVGGLRMWRIWLLDSTRRRSINNAWRAIARIYVASWRATRTSRYVGAPAIPAAHRASSTETSQKASC